MAVSQMTQFKATVLKTVIDQITGGSCTLVQRENSIKIVLTEQQKDWLRKFLDTQLEMKTRPDIEIDVLDIILPVVWKRAWPFVAAGGAGLGALVWKAFSKGGHRQQATGPEDEL